MQVFKLGKKRCNLNLIFVFKVNFFLILKNKSYQCYCGNKYGSYGTAKSRGRACNKTCTKSVNDICGGMFANSVYQINPSFTTSTTSTTLEIDNFTDTTNMPDSLETAALSGNYLV